MGHFPSLLSLLKNRHKIIAYRGFLGDGNFGDELVYWAAKALFRPYVILPLKSQVPIFTKIMLELGVIKYRGEIIGGGTLIGRACVLLNEFNEIFIHGTGVKSVFSDDWVSALKRKNLYGGVRGSASLRALNAKGLNVEDIGDAAFCLYSDNVSSLVSNNLVLVNLGTHASDPALEVSRNKVLKFIEVMLARKVSVGFIPFHETDRAIGNELKNTFSEIQVYPIPNSFECCSDLFRRAEFVVGERLHFIVMALLCHRPFFSIMYHPKHMELLDSLGCVSSGQIPEKLELDNILAAYDLRDAFNWEHVREKLIHYRKKQEGAAAAYIESIGNP